MFDLLGLTYVVGVCFLLLGIMLILWGIRLYSQPKVGHQISVSRETIPNLSEPVNRFYSRLYQSFKSGLRDRVVEDESTPIQVDLTGMGFGPHRLFAAPSLMAERPLYLLVRYKHLRCYIFAGQTTSGLFVSCWTYSDYHLGEDGLLAPTQRAWRYFAKQTLFQVDSALMFMESVHQILSETISDCMQEEGLKVRDNSELRPIMHAFYENPYYPNSRGQRANHNPNAVDADSTPASPTTSTGSPSVRSRALAVEAAGDVGAGQSSISSPASSARPASSLFPMDDWLRNDGTAATASTYRYGIQAEGQNAERVGQSAAYRTPDICSSNTLNDEEVRPEEGSDEEEKGRSGI